MRKPLLFMALLFAVPLFAQSPGPETTAAIDSLFKTWQQPGHPGGVVGILQDGKLVLSRAYGLASLEYEVPIDTATVFNVGSVSKQFTAFSIVLLAQQGKLSLDDDIRKHLPELPDFGAVITLRHCLNHTSGMRNFQNLLAMAGWTSLPWLWMLRQPTLIMAGSDDPLVPMINARMLNTMIPNSRLEVLDDGHLFLVTRPKESAAMIEAFLRD